MIVAVKRRLEQVRQRNWVVLVVAVLAPGNRGALYTPRPSDVYREIGSRGLLDGTGNRSAGGGVAELIRPRHG